MSEEIEIIDLGAATEVTKGAFSLVLLELGTPPFNWYFSAPTNLSSRRPFLTNSNKPQRGRGWAIGFA